MTPQLALGKIPRMSTVTEIEAAIEQLSHADRLKLARWWQKRFDPDEGLELSEEALADLETAQAEIKRGETANWDQLKRRVKPASQ